MPKRNNACLIHPATLIALVTLAVNPLAFADNNDKHSGEFSETRVLIEINATDGDAGFHALFDAGPWKEVKMRNPGGVKIFDEKASGPLKRQGLTENFFESAEPVCDEEDAEDGEPVVTLAQFLSRFPSGEYTLSGKTNTGHKLDGSATLTYNLPAAPDVELTEGMAFLEGDDVVIMWEAGDDLGDKCHDDALIPGVITDPAEVEIVGWEVVVEAADGDDIMPNRKFVAQLPPEYTSVIVPGEFIDAYIDENDVTEFKFEIGAIEASGNQTFTEAEFCIVESEEDQCEEDDEE